MEDLLPYDGNRPAPPPRDDLLAAVAAWHRWLGVDDDTTIAQLRDLVDPSGQAVTP